MDEMDRMDEMDEMDRMGYSHQKVDKFWSVFGLDIGDKHSNQAYI